jgi:hypothetical protein
MSFRFRLLLITLALLIPAVGVALLKLPRSGRHVAQDSAVGSSGSADAVAELQRKIDSGKLKLEFDEQHGYLSSLLQVLNIPVSSQTLVFSKSSFLLDLISPKTPRAIYFNDDVYVGWVQRGSMLEVAAVDPVTGPVFYTLSQDGETRPKFERQTNQCLVCHDTFQAETPVPRLLVLSVLPNPVGNAISAAALVTDDTSPLRERWGGWYVTGTHGEQRHLGNTLVRASSSEISEENMKAYIARMDLSAGANLTGLNSHFDTKSYLTPHSDIVALMILGHQTDVHNRITSAIYKLQAATQAHQSLEEIADLMKRAAEPLVRTLLFWNEAPLTEPITGTSGFAEEFVRQGPRDSHGRSLRDLDLKHRLLRYPLSYLIYSKSFDAMASPIKDYVYRRLREVLNGEDKSGEFAYLTQSDREAILGILEETKPEFAARKDN